MNRPASDQRVPATAPPPSVHLEWPADRFYWAVLDVPPGVKVARGRDAQRATVPVGLLGDLAEQLPVPLDDVHPVCALVGEATRPKLVVCTAMRSDLEAMPIQALTLRPAELPSAFGIPSSLAGSLNLLTGDFEPASQRRRRVRGHWLGIASVALTAALIVTGLVRRTNNLSGVAAEARASAARMLAAALPPGAPPESLPAEVARLQQASLATASIKPVPDAAAALAALLKRWPINTPSTPQSIGVNESGITISVLVKTDPSEFLRAFAASTPPGWHMQEPRLNAGAEFTRIVIDLRPPSAPSLTQHPNPSTSPRGDR